MPVTEIIDLASRRVMDGCTLNSSAALCLDDAIALLTAGNLNAARTRALKSLEYSVGVFHADYLAAQSKGA